MYSGNSKIEGITFVLAAAGVGKRMGLGYPKQFLEYEGKPLFIKPLEVAQASELIKQVIVVTGKESIEFVKNQCIKYGIKKVTKVVEGGSERQYSIEKALAHCSNDSIIAVHDGVRPFLKEKYFREALKILSDNRNVNGVIVGVRVKDTIKKVNDNGDVVDTPKRSELIAAHTPQIFRGEILKSAYKKAHHEKYLGTDDSSLVERYSGGIRFLLGDYDNIKITTIEDLKYL